MQKQGLCLVQEEEAQIDEERWIKNEQDERRVAHLIDEGASSTDPVQALVLHVVNAPFGAWK
jgi:hypothetical protein